MKILKRARKRGLALFMALVMCLSLLPVTAMAAEEPARTETAAVTGSEQDAPAEEPGEDASLEEAADAEDTPIEEAADAGDASNGEESNAGDTSIEEETTPEDVSNDIPEIHTAEIEASRTGGTVKCSMAKLVIASPFLRVAKHFIGFIDFFEFFLCRFAVWV